VRTAGQHIAQAGDPFGRCSRAKAVLACLGVDQARAQGQRPAMTTFDLAAGPMRAGLGGLSTCCPHPQSVTASSHPTDRRRSTGPALYGKRNLAGRLLRLAGSRTAGDFPRPSTTTSTANRRPPSLTRWQADPDRRAQRGRGPEAARQHVNHSRQRSLCSVARGTDVRTPRDCQLGSWCPVPKIADYVGMRQEPTAVFAVGCGAAPVSG